MIVDRSYFMSSRVLFMVDLALPYRNERDVSCRAKVFKREAMYSPNPYVVSDRVMFDAYLLNFIYLSVLCRENNVARP